MGLTLDDLDTTEVWPENWPLFQVFSAVRTQWRHGGMGGATGLDYAAIYPLLDRLEPIPGQSLLDTIDDLQAMEFSALEVLNRKRDA